MNKYILSLGAILVVGAFTSCSKDYLDPEVTDYVTESHLAELRKDAKVVKSLSKASIAATYNDLQTFWRSHDDFGLKAFQIQSDMLGEDMPYVGLKADWFHFDYEYDNFNAGWRRTRTTWDMFYDIVTISNIMLRDYFPGEITDPKLMALKAEPLAMRGIAYFYLVNFYQATYKGHEQAMGVPLSLSPDDPNLPRASVEEVYKQIVEDLKYAADNGAYTDERTDADRAVAAAYLAKVYATMEDWSNAEKYAAIAQEGDAEDVTPSLPMGWSISNKDVLWGYDVTPNTSTYWASFYSHMDPTIVNYAGKEQEKGIYNWLYQQMGQKDVRRTLYVNNTQYPAIAAAYPGHGRKYTNTKEEKKDKDGKVVIGKDGKPEYIYYIYDYYALKFVAPEGTLSDYIFLRVQDPILLEIEAMNEQGKTAEAAAKLTAFMKNRDPEYVAPTEQAALREQIRLNRRIELWGEGTSWFDFRRWKLLVDRSKPAILADGTEEESNHYHITKNPVDLNNLKYIHYLPKREVENNKLLKQDERP